LSKAIISSAISTSIFLLYEFIALLSSGQISNILAGGFISTIICGFAIYSALGVVLCLFSMLIKNSTTSTIVCLCYVLFSETLWSAIRNLSSFSSIVVKIVEIGFMHSIYGMSTIISSTSLSTGMAMNIIFNSVVIMLLATQLGLAIFKKYEL
jgi:hypothetical protein